MSAHSYSASGYCILIFYAIGSVAFGTPCVRFFTEFSMRFDMAAFKIVFCLVKKLFVPCAPEPQVRVAVRFRAGVRVRANRKTSLVL